MKSIEGFSLHYISFSWQLHFQSSMYASKNLECKYTYDKRNKRTRPRVSLCRDSWHECRSIRGQLVTDYEYHHFVSWTRSHQDIARDTQSFGSEIRGDYYQRVKYWGRIHTEVRHRIGVSSPDPEGLIFNIGELDMYYIQTFKNIQIIE